VGLLFGELTRDGVEYVKEAIADAASGFGSKEVVEFWRQHYADKGYDL
jgi:isocitrate lyase